MTLTNLRAAEKRIWFRHMALSQDKIGWRRFLEGMISTEITSIQRQYIAVNGSRMSLDKWCTGLITRLLEITHGQWLYRNYIVHDPVSGIIATARKEELLVEIERQRELGDAGLLEEDKYLAEVNLEEISTSSGERQHYWLLAIQTARNHYALRAQRESQQMAQRDTTVDPLIPGHGQTIPRSASRTRQHHLNAS